MFKEALIASSKALTKLKAKGLIEEFGLIGGLALAAYSEPRATGDIDYVIQIGSGTLEDVARALKGESHRGDIYDPLAGSVTFSIKSKDGKVAIQLVQFHSAIEAIAIDSIEPLSLGRAVVPVVSRRSLVVLKLYAGGPIDLDDARKLYESRELKAKDREYIAAKVKNLRLLSRLKKIGG